MSERACQARERPYARIADIYILSHMDGQTGLGRYAEWGLKEPVGDKLLHGVSEVRHQGNLRIPGGKAMGKPT